MNLREDWSSSSVTDRPENSKDKEEVERKTETKEEGKEARLEEEEESGSRKIVLQKKISKYSLQNSAFDICTFRTSRDHVYLDGEGLEMPSSSSSSLSSSSSRSGVSKELSPPSGSRGSSPAVQNNGALSASNVSCAAATIFEGRRQELSPTNRRGPMRGSGIYTAADRQSFGGKDRIIVEPEPGDQHHST